MMVIVLGTATILNQTVWSAKADNQRMNCWKAADIKNLCEERGVHL